MTDYRTGDVITVTNHLVEVLRTKRDPELGLVIVGVKWMKDGSRREGSVFVDAPDTTVELVARAAPRDDQLGAEEITPTIAQHVLWHYGERGMQPGSFTKGLIALIARADPHNRRRLATAAPGYVAACNWAEASDGGIADLRKIAAGEQ